MHSEKTKELFTFNEGFIFISIRKLRLFYLWVWIIFIYIFFLRVILNIKNWNILMTFLVFNFARIWILKLSESESNVFLPTPQLWFVGKWMTLYMKYVCIHKWIEFFIKNIHKTFIKYSNVSGEILHLLIKKLECMYCVGWCWDYNRAHFSLSRYGYTLEQYGPIFLLIL